MTLKQVIPRYPCEVRLHSARTVSPLVQSLAPPRISMPGADRTRRRVGQGPSSELIIEWCNDSAQFDAGAAWQCSQSGFQIVTGEDRITARAVGPRNVQPAARPAQEASIPVKRLEDASGPLRDLNGGLRSPADTGNLNHRSAITGLSSIGAHSAGPPTRHCPLGSTSCRHDATPAAERRHPIRSTTGLASLGLARISTSKRRCSDGHPVAAVVGAPTTQPAASRSAVRSTNARDVAPVFSAAVEEVGVGLRIPSASREWTGGDPARHVVWSDAVESGHIARAYRKVPTLPLSARTRALRNRPRHTREL